MRRFKPGVSAAFTLLLPLLALSLCGVAAQQQQSAPQPAAAVIPVIPVVPVVPVQPQTASQPQSPQLQQTTGAQLQPPQQSSMTGGYIVQPRVVPLVARPVSAAAPLGDAVYEPQISQPQQGGQQGQLMSSGLSARDKAAVMQAHKVSARPAAAGS
jgi:hypothetical protein